VLGLIGFDYRPALLAPRVVAWLLGEYRERTGQDGAPSVVAVVSEAGYPPAASRRSTTTCASPPATTST
jgi:hypothetical protein